MTTQKAIDVLEIFTTDEFQRNTSSEFDDALSMAIKALKEQYAFNYIIELLENEKGIAFLTLANTGDDKYDFAYDNVVAHIDRVIKNIKEEIGYESSN